MHTKEPWIVTGSDRVKYIESRISKGMLQEIASCLPVDEDHGNNEANARRIVACVNACAGFANPEKDIPAIETASKMHFDQAMANGQRASEYEAQRDELLAALKDARAIFALAYDCAENGRSDECLLHLGVGGARADKVIAKCES